MVALNLLAASLLVAGVGSSLGLPSPMNASVLPAICSFKSGDSFGFVSPVLDRLDITETPADDAYCDFYFGDEPGLLDSAAFWILEYSSDSDSISVGSYSAGGLDNMYCICLFGVDILNFSLILPSFEYWHDDSIGVALFEANSDFGNAYGYYGVFAEDAGSIFLTPVLSAELGADVNPVTAITDGLTAIVPLGGVLTDGFDAVFMDDGALTAVGMFAFILMGVGISVGITKKCFNWVTGRHGM